jgi:hypothetical protein
MSRTQKFWQRHRYCISRDDFSEAPNEVYHHRLHKDMAINPFRMGFSGLIIVEISRGKLQMSANPYSLKVDES